MMKIVAEMMILANAAVGARIAAAFPGAALLRRHPPPRRQAFEEASGGWLCRGRYWAQQQEGQEAGEETL